MAAGEDAAAGTDLAYVNVLTYAFLCVVTFGIGSSVPVDEVRSVLREKKLAVAVALICQYLVMPATARFVASALLQMPAWDSFGVVLLGCCPGGAASNALAYFAKADMALSVSMTAVSNLLAFATLPGLLFLWTRGLGSVTTEIPFAEIAYSLLMVLVPAAAGIAVRHFRPVWAQWTERVGAAGGGCLIASSCVAGFIRNGTTLGDPYFFPWKTGVAVCLVAPIGMLSSLGAAKVATLAAKRPPLPPATVATVVIETGVQNTVLGLAIVNFSAAKLLDADALFRLQMLVLMWGLFVSLEAVPVMLIFRVVISRHNKVTSDAQAND